MGLKTTNYYIKKFDLTLPTAYAKLRTLVLNSDGRVSAKFSIQQTRAHCNEFQPIDTVEYTTKNAWDRNVPLEKFAYEAIKMETYVEKDEFTGIDTQKTDHNPLFGWTDDIVKGE
jgi:hypothetical protein